MRKIWCFPLTLIVAVTTVQFAVSRCGVWVSGRVTWLSRPVTVSSLCTAAAITCSQQPLVDDRSASTNRAKIIITSYSPAQHYSMKHCDQVSQSVGGISVRSLAGRLRQAVPYSHELLKFVWIWHVLHTRALMCAKKSFRLLIFSSFLYIWENVEWPRFLDHPVYTDFSSLLRGTSRG